MDVSRALTTVTSNIFPGVDVCDLYQLTLLVSSFYLDELYIGAPFPYSSVQRDGMCNWWPVLTEEVE